MDDMIINKNKVLFGKLKSSIRNIFPGVMSNNNISLNFLNKVDIDSDDKEPNNYEFSSDLSSRENIRLEYRRNFIKNLEDLKNKNQSNEDNFSFKSKFNRHNISVKDDAISSPESNKLKMNYRTLCDDVNSEKLNECTLSSTNRLNTSGFLSILNNSMDEFGISSIASRISGNILNRNLLQDKEVLNKTKSTSNLSTKSFSMKTRRYRTIVKKDKFPYLIRAAKENLFSVPALGTSNITLNLNYAENPTKRIDFSYTHTINSENLNVKKCDISNVLWDCNNCNSSNSSNFNFCPTCSASNPKLVFSEKHFKSLIEDTKNVWICSRCATTNEELRLVCIFCFKNKNESSKKPKLDISFNEKPRSNNNNKVDEKTFKFGISSNKNVEQFSPGSNDKLICVGDIENKSIMSECSDRNEELSKLPNLFGSSNSQIMHFKFGSFDQSKEIPKSTIELDGKVSRSCPEAKFNCSICLVNNQHNTDKCVCSTKNPSMNVDNEIRSDIRFGIPNQQSIFKFGSSDFIDESAAKISIEQDKFCNKWNCQGCWTENDIERGNCACSAKNPSKSNFSSDSNITTEAPKSIFIFGTSKSTDDTTISKILFGKEETIKPFNNTPKSTNKWTCSDCWAENETERDKCACCFSKNPSTAKMNCNFQTTSKCEVSNSTITSDETLKSTFNFGTSDSMEVTNPSQIVQDDIPTVPLIGALQKGLMKNNQRKWECVSCLVENDVSADSCICCRALNPDGSCATIQTSPFKYNINPLQTTFKLRNSGTPDATKFKHEFKKGSSQVEAVNSLNGHGEPDKIDAPFKFGKFSNVEQSVLDSSNSDSDLMIFNFSPPHSLEMSISTEVFIDLVFDFATPQIL